MYTCTDLTYLWIIGDIWSENGDSILVVMGYWIDCNFIMNEKLLVCQPFSASEHTGDNIRRVTLQGLVDMGIANNTNEVADHVHGCTPDEGSNMLKAWKIFEGAGCVCHRANNCLQDALKEDGISFLIGKVKGICAHFHRSIKVFFEFFVCALSFVNSIELDLIQCVGVWCIA